MDFLKSPETLAAQMKEKGIKSDYVFFFSYIQPAAKEGGDLWSAAEELVKINSKLFANPIPSQRSYIRCSPRV